MEILLEPFRFDFMLRSFAAAIMVGIVCSVIGTFVVVRSMAFLGDALAHAVLPGVAIAYIFGGNLTVGALIAAIVWLLAGQTFEFAIRKKLKRTPPSASSSPRRLRSGSRSSARFGLTLWI